MTYHRTIPATNDRAGLIVMTVLFSVLSIAVVALRIYARRLSAAPLLVDDWLSILSLIFVLGLNSVFLGATIQGAITGHSIVKDDYPVTSDLEHLAEKYKYAFQSLEKLTFGLIKLSILFLWKRIFSPVRSFQIACWFMVAFISAWSIAFFFTTVFQCGTNFALNWAPLIVFFTECGSGVNTFSVITVYAVLDVVGDIIIICLPIPRIWALQMSKERKTGVTAIFLIGLLAVGAGIARMYLYLGTSYDRSDNPDFLADYTNFILWSEIEANVAMLCSCMPTLIPVLIRIKTFSTTGSREKLFSKRSYTWRPKKSKSMKLDSLTDLTYKSHSSRPYAGPLEKGVDSQRVITSGATNTLDVEEQNPNHITVTQEFSYGAEQT